MINKKNSSSLWRVFAKRYALTERQLEQFQLYAHLLQEWNEKINLTALTSIEDIIPFHFQDSIEVIKYVDFNHYTSVADVGTGAGFPAIPLKILFPHLHLVLIEVNNKKIRFMQTVIDRLELDNVCFASDDWRTFLRTTDMPIDLFVARASLQPAELLRIYKPRSCYNNKTFIYWASQHWKPRDVVKPYIKEEYAYMVGSKKRRYVFFGNKKV